MTFDKEEVLDDLLNKLDNQYSLAHQDGREGWNRREDWWIYNEQMLSAALTQAHQAGREEAIEKCSQIAKKNLLDEDEYDCVVRIVNEIDHLKETK